MATQRWILFLLAAAMISLLAGCNGGSTANVQNPQPPPQSSVSIAFQPEPGGSLAVNSSENLIAVVTNDPNNYGVDWSLSCQSGSGTCGALSAQHTASGAANTYTAPSILSTSSMVVEIVAYATAADDLKNVVAPITITTFDSGLQAGTMFSRPRALTLTLALTSWQPPLSSMVMGTLRMVSRPPITPRRGPCQTPISPEVISWAPMAGE